METTTRRSASRRRWGRALGTGATAVLATGAMAASAGAAATPANAPIGASGSVAALSTSSMEVQNASSGQTTVNWTSTTNFSKTVTESVSSLSVGDCITATGSPSKKSKTTIAARNINVTQATTSGACPGMAGFRANLGAGGGPQGSGGLQFRTGGPSGGQSGGGFKAPSNFRGGAGSNFRRLAGSFAIASGKVTGISGSTITVSGITLNPGSRPTQSKNGKNSKTSKPTAPKTQTLKVTTSSSTPVSATETAASTDLAVGDCVSAFGPAATNGSVTATNVRITSTTAAGNCSAGPPGVAGGPGVPGGGGPVIFGGPGGGGA